MHTPMIKILALLSLLSCLPVKAEPVQFSLTDLNGKTHTSKDYAGKWLIVNYWAMWCPPCRDEIPELVAFHEKYKDKDAVVLGIDFENADDINLREFIDENFISYPVVQTRPSAKGPFGPIYALPTTYLISPKGEIVASRTGGVTIQDLEKGIHRFKQELAQTNSPAR